MSMIKSVQVIEVGFVKKRISPAKRVVKPWNKGCHKGGNNLHGITKTSEEKKCSSTDESKTHGPQIHDHFQPTRQATALMFGMRAEGADETHRAYTIYDGVDFPMSTQSQKYGCDSPAIVKKGMKSEENKSQE